MNEVLLIWGFVLRLVYEEIVRLVLEGFSKSVISVISDPHQINPFTVLYRSSSVAFTHLSLGFLCGLFRLWTRKIRRDYFTFLQGIM